MNFDALLGLELCTVVRFTCVFLSKTGEQSEPITIILLVVINVHHRGKTSLRVIDCLNILAARE